MNTSSTDCSGTPFNFQPEYNTAPAQNVIPWGFGPYMINSEFEIGHFEPCTRSPAAEPGDARTGDTYYTNCYGPVRDAARRTPTLEPDDAPCYPFGDTHGGTAAPNLVTGCDVFIDAIGDLDYDGTPYYPDWPNSVTPGPVPVDVPAAAADHRVGQRYPQIQFVTDNSATQFNTNCDPVIGSGLRAPAAGTGELLPVLDPGPGRRGVRVGVRQHAQRQHVRR